MSLYRPRVRSSATERQVKNWLNFVSSGGGGAVIQSVQTGTINLNNVTSATATISSVVVANTMLLMGGNANYVGGLYQLNTYLADVTLTNSTTVTASRNTAEATQNLVRFVVVEFAAGVLKSSQFGVATYSGTTYTATITSVNTAKAFVVYLGAKCNSTAGVLGDYIPQVTLTNSTTVTGSSANPVATTNLRFCVIEFN